MITLRCGDVVSLKDPLEWQNNLHGVVEKVEKPFVTVTWLDGRTDAHVIDALQKDERTWWSKDAR